MDPDLLIADVSDRIGAVLQTHNQLLDASPKLRKALSRSKVPAPLSAAALAAVTTDIAASPDFWSAAPNPAVGAHGPMTVAVVFDGDRWGLALDLPSRPMCLKIDDTAAAAPVLSAGACPTKHRIAAPDWSATAAKLGR